MPRACRKAIITLEEFIPQQAYWHAKGKTAKYRGSPLHKRSPADFGLVPPSSARQSKTLCDAVEHFKGPGAREAAQRLLEDAFTRGLLSVQLRGGWPQNVWCVLSGDVVLEAMLDEPCRGVYHGYPLAQGAPCTSLYAREQHHDPCSF